MMINLIPDGSGIHDITKKLSRYGIAVIPNFLNPELLQKLRNEFHEILAVEEKTSPYFLKKGDSRCARINGLVNPKHFPITTDVFGADFIKQVAEAYYSPYPFNLHAQLYITHDRNFMDFSSDWHTDLTQSLKFFFYLTDTTAENGAFKYVPGSHREGIYRIMYYRQKGIDTFPNHFREEDIPDAAMSIEAPAGSLLIFEAAGLHRAGVLTHGKERMVMRTHTYSRSTRLGRGVRKILRKLPFNLSKYHLCEDDKINAEFFHKGVLAEYL